MIGRGWMANNGWREPMPGRWIKDGYVIQQIVQWAKRETYWRLSKDGEAIAGRFESAKDAAQAAQKLERKGVAA